MSFSQTAAKTISPFMFLIALISLVVICQCVNNIYVESDSNFVETNCVIDDNYIVKVFYGYKYPCYYAELYANYIFEDRLFSFKNSSGSLTQYNFCKQDIKSLKNSIEKYLLLNSTTTTQICYIDRNQKSLFILNKTPDKFVVGIIVLFSILGASAVAIMFMLVYIQS